MDRRRWEEIFKPYSVFGGELLITKLGEPPGACAIYPLNSGPAMVTPDVIKLSVDTDLAVPLYLMYYLNSPVARRFTSGAAFGTTRLRLTIPLFRELPVPLPPFSEQKQIVGEVERRLSIVDEIEAQVEANVQRAARLRQGVLKRAFEGRLVPQDPTDEPAEKLLDRVRQQRHATTTAPNGTPRTRQRGRRRSGGSTLPLFPEGDLGAPEMRPGASSHMTMRAV